MVRFGVAYITAHKWPWAGHVERQNVTRRNVFSSEDRGCIDEVCDARGLDELMV